MRLRTRIQLPKIILIDADPDPQPWFWGGGVGGGGGVLWTFNRFRFCRRNLISSQRWICWPDSQLSWSGAQTSWRAGRRPPCSSGTPPSPLPELHTSSVKGTAALDAIFYNFRPNQRKNKDLDFFTFVKLSNIIRDGEFFFHSTHIAHYFLGTVRYPKQKVSVAMATISKRSETIIR